MIPEKSTRWKNALNKLWARDRVHSSPDMSAAYQDLKEIYENTEVFGFPSGDRCGSWTSPPSWIVKFARLIGPDGEIIADWENHHLHLYTYSPSFSGKVSREELEDHLFSIPSKPDRIPFHFRNQYRFWEPEWGFCITQKVRDKLPSGNYSVEISTKYEDGLMEMAEQVHTGRLKDSILLVGHFDHPHMCNDGLVGCLAGHEIITRLANTKTHLTYRMLSTVEIVGSVFYAGSNAKQNSVCEALFVAAAGAQAPLAYQTSFSGNSVLDRIMRHVMSTQSAVWTEHEFRLGLLGNDETAFDVGGVDIPCGSIMRGPFEQYHTDDDTPDNVDPENFEEVVNLVSRVISIIERNATLERQFSGLPCLSSPDLDLYFSPTLMSSVEQDVLKGNFFSNLPDEIMNIVHQRTDRLNYLMNILPIMCDNHYTVLDIAEKTNLPFEFVDLYTDQWVEKGLLKKHWKHPFSNNT